MENNENKGWNNGWNNRTIGGTLQNNGWNNENKARKYIKNLYDDILNTMFTLLTQNFVRFATRFGFYEKFRATILFLQKISSNDFVFTKNFEQRFCFLRKISRKNFTCKVNGNSFGFCFLQNISSNDFVFTKNFEQRFCFLQKFRATILFLQKISRPNLGFRTHDVILTLYLYDDVMLQ